MMMRKITLSAIGIAWGLGLGLASAQAEVVQVPGAPAPQARASVPSRGLTMAQVEQRYGAPADRIAAVGKPPIARWVYPSFVVYFEYNLVIHAVATQATASTN
jgi:hypothetical protein